jgi:hypothetical protein
VAGPSAFIRRESDGAGTFADTLAIAETSSRAPNARRLTRNIIGYFLT